MAANPKHVSKAALALVEQSKVESVKVADNRKAKVKAPKVDVTSLPGMVRYAFAKENRLSVWLGLPMAAGLPIAGYVLAHLELPVDFASVVVWSDWLFIVAKIVAVLGILLWSALTVNQWGKRSFRDARKAIGFTIGVELVMLISDTTWLAIAMCVLLVGINIIGTTVNIALGQKATEE